MDLLRIVHTDFTLFIDCTKFEEVWQKAKANLGEEQLHTVYTWTEGVREVTVGGLAVEHGVPSKAVFFDNTDYPVWVEFNAHVRLAWFGSSLQSENEQFSFRRGVLAGFLNYGNDIGHSELRINYEGKDGLKQFRFRYEVLSSKLDYHLHWRAIVEDIEAEYRMLSLAYMRRTFHGFSPSEKGETPELVWWSIFAEEQEKFVRACRNIIERPHHRLHRMEAYKRADQLTTIPRGIENALAEHRKEPGHLFRIEERVYTNDTPENRFLKFALSQIADKYASLKQRIEQTRDVSDILRMEMERTLSQLQRLRRNPFFRGVGRFKGLTQASLTLQQGTGYSLVYRTWNMLRRAYSLEDGVYRLQTKDIATLYEIWCFIEVSHIIKERLNIGDDDVEQRNRMEMNGLFTWELGKGEHSRILFKKHNVELAELIYNPKSTNKEYGVTGMVDVIVPTVPQKPDIVLQLTKNDLTEGMKMTYLFDAKYRIAGRENGVDTPPDDAINQMHRYRDAIYYQDKQHHGLKKEVVGGYILFPGNGEPKDVALSRFQKSIEEVNIGAFPLRPNDDQNRALLGKFIDTLIGSSSAKIVSDVIPQKGAIVEVGNRVLIGLVTDSSRKGYMQSFIDGTATLYYTGSHFPTTIALQDLHFFMPYAKKLGIRDVYEITRIRTLSSKEIKQHEGENVENDLRLAFELRFYRRQYIHYQPINTSKMMHNTFIDTTFEKLIDILK